MHACRTRPPSVATCGHLIRIRHGDPDHCPSWRNIISDARPDRGFGVSSLYLAAPAGHAARCDFPLLSLLSFKFFSGP